MNNLLAQQKQIAILSEWQDEIDTCMSRLEHAAANAVRAVQKWNEFTSLADPSDAVATGQAVATSLLAKESSSLPNLATLIKTFAQATGQTHEQVITKLTSAINA